MKTCASAVFMLGLFLMFNSCNHSKDSALTTYTLSVAASPSNGGSISKSPDQSQYSGGTNVSLTAAASAGYQFTRWEGDATGTSSNTTITMNANKNVTGVFTTNPVQYTLNVTVTSTVGGLVEKSPDQAQYASGTTVTLTAKAANGYQFARWEGDVTGTTSPVTVTMNANKNVTAVFVAVVYVYLVNTSVTPTGGGTVIKSPNQSSYSGGSTVTLTATPASGYQFVRWEGDLTGSTNPATLTVNGNKSVTAVFSPIQYTLNITSSPASGGSVTKTPNQAQYSAGTAVSLTATAANGYQFTRWEGDVTGTTNPVSVTMNGNKTVTAVFTADLYSAPTLTAPTTSTGTFTASITYSWGLTGTNLDYYELEESKTSSTTGFSSIHKSAAGTHTSPYNISMTKTSGTYYYRARVYRGSPSPGFSAYSSVVTVVVTEQTRSITLINNGPTTVMLTDIVQVKMARYESNLYVRTDLLTDDPGQCLRYIGESISPGQSQKFDVAVGPNFSVFIGMGKWETFFALCGSTYPWVKRTYVEETGTGRNVWVWVTVNVTDAPASNWNWTISGSYLNGTLKVTPAGNNGILFNRTYSSKIP